MKRLILVVFVLFLAAPSIGSAQITYELAGAKTVVPAEMIGEGWELFDNEVGGSVASGWDRRLTYFGPAGASVVIEATELGDSIHGMAEAWVDLALDVFERNSPVDFETTDAAIDHEAISDTVALEGSDPATGQPVGVCLYGSLSERIAVVIRTEGTVNELTGVAASDYIAGLYFAALSGE